MKRSVIILLVLFLTGISGYSMTPYEEGYKAGYELGFNTGYKTGYEKGTIAGSTSGLADGRKQGRYSVLAPYLNFSYGPSIEKFSDKNITLRKSFRSTWEEGYDLGYREGKTQGYQSGYDQARSIEYKNAFRKAYLESEQKTHEELYYRDGVLMTDLSQYEYGIECFQSKRFDDAKNHFTVVLRDFTDSVYIKESLWWCAKTCLELNKATDAAIIYLSLTDNFPSMREKAALEAARVLFNLKTQNSDGTKNTYYKKTIYCTKLLISEFPESDLVPEATYLQGQCYQNLHLNETAHAVFQKLIGKYPNSPFADMARAAVRNR